MRLLFLVLGPLLIVATFVFSFFPELAQNFSLYKIASAQTTLPDLDVTNISRTPNYYRYDVQYLNGNARFPQLAPGTENQKRWPDVGETVTYTARIVNKGQQTINGFNYTWKVNGQVVESGQSAIIITPYIPKGISMTRTFPSTPETIEFITSLVETGDEITTNNNALTIGSHDLTLSVWIEAPFYNLFNQTLNAKGSYSFEDWFQTQIATMNERFSQAVYPTSPQGIKDRVRVDKFAIPSDLDAGNSPFKTGSSGDPDYYLNDGRWPFADGDPTNAEGEAGEYQTYINQNILGTDWGLIHELMHQLGVIDQYHMGVGADLLNINNGGLVEMSDLPNSGNVFPYEGLMGGGSTSPYNSETYIDQQTAAALNTNYLKRRGYFGEYLFDMPQTVKVKILDSHSNIVPNAQLHIYQRNSSAAWPYPFDNTPEIIVSTDSQGIATLPNRAVTAVTTATGHSLQNNPFGQIVTWGVDSIMIIRTTKGASEGFGYLTVHDLNMAYYEGQTQAATININTSYPIPLPTANLLSNGDFGGTYDPNATIPVWTTNNQYSGNWVCRPGGTAGSCIYTQDQTFLGDYSVQVEHNGTSSWGNQIGQGYFNVQPEERLCIRGWVKKSHPTMSVTIAIQELALGYTHEANNSAAHDDWQELRRTVWSKSHWSDGGTKIQVFARARSTGTAWFDDISLTRGECPY